MSTLKVGTIQDHANSNTAISIDSGGRVTLNQQPMFQLGGVTGTISAGAVIPMKQLPAGGTVGTADSFLLGGCTFNDSSSELTLANAGRYMFNCTMIIRTTNGNHQMGPVKIQRKASGGTYSSVIHSQMYQEGGGQNTFHTFHTSFVQNVAAGDVFRWINNGSQSIQFPNAADSGLVFNGFLLTSNVS